MHPTETQTVLLSAVEVVLETACCACVFESREQAPLSGGEPAIAVLVSFDGKPSGEFSLHVPETVALQLAAGFLGLDDGDVSAAQAAEVACELANMICGAVLSNLCASASFHMSHPLLAQEERDADCAAICRWFDLGGGSLTACLRFREAS
ncbi:MAG: chemotaxis protein CheX [Bryobacterales bacterium]|nr:chemotaxis protein CheX [Bryobacterales bacterium]